MAHRDLTRREFLGRAAAAAAAVGALPLRDVLAEEDARPVVCVARNDSPRELVRKALETLGGMARFVRKGETVLVKPNIGFDRKPEFAATTNPDVLGETIRQCLAAGAGKVRVFDRSVNNERRCAESSGIRAATEAAGGTFEFVNTSRFRKLGIDGASRLAQWEFYRDALEVDAIVNVPIAKHHSLARLTMCFKNWMGLVGGKRGDLHGFIADHVIDLHRIFGARTRLHLLDAYRILVRNGPSGGRLEDVKETRTVVASTDPVACEAVAASLFDLAPDRVPSVVAAHEAGFGEMNLSRIEVNTVDAG